MTEVDLSLETRLLMFLPCEEGKLRTKLVLFHMVQDSTHEIRILLEPFSTGTLTAFSQVA